MMNIDLDHRGVDPQLAADLQTELHSGLNDQIVDGFERLRRQPVEAAVERVMLGYRIAVESGELAQRHAVGDAFAQLAIVPVLEPHQNQRAQDLRRRQSVTTAAGLLQAPHQIAPDTLDDVLLIVEKSGYRFQQRLQPHALITLPHQLPIGKTDLSRRRSHTAQLFLLLGALLRSRFKAFT